MACPKCNGLTVDEEGFAWRCVNCGKRGQPQDRLEFQQAYARFVERVRVAPDRWWLRFWKRRRIQKGYGSL